MYNLKFINYFKINPNPISYYMKKSLSLGQMEKKMTFQPSLPYAIGWGLIRVKKTLNFMSHTLI